MRRQSPCPGRWRPYPVADCRYWPRCVGRCWRLGNGTTGPKPRDRPGFPTPCPRGRRPRQGGGSTGKAGPKEKGAWVTKRREGAITLAYRTNSGMTTPQPLEVRQKKLIFRAWHRGTREADLLMGRFADAFVP